MTGVPWQIQLWGKINEKVGIDLRPHPPSPFIVKNLRFVMFHLQMV